MKTSCRWLYYLFNFKLKIKGKNEYLVQDHMATPAGRLESRVVAGSKCYSSISLLLFNCTTIIHPVTPFCTKQRRFFSTISVTRILLNHSSAWKLVVQEIGDKTEITTIAIRVCFHVLYISCDYQYVMLCTKI